MTLAVFISRNKAEIDHAIRRAVSNPEYKINDYERRLWIANDEPLYRWALSEGVDVESI